MNDEWRMTKDEGTGAAVRPVRRRGHSPASHHSTFRICHSSFRASGFTLVEIIIALTIIIIITAAAIPTFKGLRAEQEAREPVQELTRLAKEARLRAMREKRPYQVVIHAGGFTASRYLSPYLQMTQLTEFLQEVEQKASEPPPEEEAGNDLNKTRQTGDQVIYTKTAETSGKKFEDWTEEYKLPQNMHCTVKMWYEPEYIPVEGEIVKLWVFQPSGISTPFAIHLENESVTLNVEYGALTADIVKESMEIK